MPRIMAGVATLMFERDGNGADLGRLNEAERQVLLLLAEGHTAKSVANELGSTPAAVNERLREARRKTGVGSSRELARLLRSQEIRHDEMGVELSPRLSDSPRQDAARRRIGVVVMPLLFLGVIGAVALASDTPTPENVVDPIFGKIPSSQDSPDIVYKKLRAEPRDAVWAPKAEQILKDRFAQIDRVGKPPALFRVLCGSTICEVMGSIDAPEPKREEADNPKTPLNKTMRELQDLPLFNDLKAKGLVRGSTMFGGTAPGTKQMAYVMYFGREK